MNDAERSDQEQQDAMKRQKWRRRSKRIWDVAALPRTCTDAFDCNVAHKLLPVCAYRPILPTTTFANTPRIESSTTKVTIARSTL
jgi:hypothetical protein